MTANLRSTRFRRRIGTFPFSVGIPFLATLGFLLAWEIGGRFLAIRTQILPTPSRILFEAQKEWGILEKHWLFTAKEAIAGFCLAIVLALPAAFLVTTRAVAVVRRLLKLPLIFPIVVLAPLALAWFGYGPRAKSLLACCLALPVLVQQAWSQACTISTEMSDLFLTLGADRLQFFRKVRLPAILPALLSGSREAIPAAVGGAVVGGFVAGDEGLGFVLVMSEARMNLPLLFAALASILVLTSVLSLALRLVERSASQVFSVRWRQPPEVLD